MRWRLLAIMYQATFWLAQVGLPFHIPAKGTDPKHTRRRRVSRRLMLRRWPIVLRPFVVVAMVIAWPFGAWHLTRLAQRVAPQALADLAATPGAQVRRLWWQSLRHNVQPQFVLAFKLWQLQRNQADAWYYDSESLRILTRINSQETLDLALDKVGFSAWCLAHEIRCIPTLAHWRNGVELTGSAKPEEDIVVKPVSGAQGVGVQMWRYSQGAFVSGKAMSKSDAFWREVAQSTKAEDELLVQPRLIGHPALADVSDPAVPFMRLNTARTVAGDTQALSAYLFLQETGVFVSMPEKRSAWPIDLASGAILAAQSALAAPDPRDQRVVGREIPDWQDACELACRAHALFPGRSALIGWDIAFTQDGPVIIEANTSVGFFFYQTALGRPISDGPWTEILDDWLTEVGE